MPLLPNRANTEDNKAGMDDRSPVPSDVYLSHITKTEFIKTKAGDGHYLSIHEKILEGEYKGRMVFLNLNLDNPNPTAVEIANKTLNSICQACNVQGVANSDELLQIPHKITVITGKGSAEYPPSNEITKFEPADSSDEAVPDFVNAEPIQESSTLISPPLPETKVEPAKTEAAEPVKTEANPGEDKLPWE